MKTLPLYPEAPQCDVGWETPLPRDASCTRCLLHTGARNVCLQPEGKPGGLYIVGEAPHKIDDTSQRPFSSGPGRYVRTMATKFWKGPIALDYSARCTLGARKDKDIKEQFFDACRPYTAQVLRAVRPTRIITLGAWAAYGLLGRKPQVHALRRGYSWYIDDETYPDASSWIPIYFLPKPDMALRNRFEAKAFEEDMQWALTAPIPSTKHYTATRSVVVTEDDALLACDDLSEADAVVFDTETSGIMHNADFRIDELTCWPRGTLHGYTWSREALESEPVRAPLRKLLADARIKKVGHNLTYDVRAVRCDPVLGVDIGEGAYADTRLLRKLVEGAVVAKLDVAAETVGMGGHKVEAKNALEGIKSDLSKLAGEPLLKPLKPTKKNPTGVRTPYVPKCILVPVDKSILDNIRTGAAEHMTYAFRYMDPDIRGRYNARDALSTSLLFDSLQPRVTRKPNLDRLWRDVVQPASVALSRMTHHGIRVDRQAVEMFEQYLQAKIAIVEARLKQYGDINYKSTPQLTELLFVKLGLPIQGKTDSGAPSTDADTLEALHGKHPIIGDITQHRTLSTMCSTYATGLKWHIRDDGRVHASFLLDGASTGRLSSTDPNLQNIPSVDVDDVEAHALAMLLRACFLPSKGKLFVEVDESQLELRVAAAVSNDPTMVAMFSRNEDFHMQTARMVARTMWGLSPEQFNALSDADKKAKRRWCKPVNFKIHYARDPEFTLANDLKCTVAEAQKVVMAVRGQFKVLTKVMDDCLTKARREGGVHALWQMQPANWRALPELADGGDENRGRRMNAENASWNSVIQGSAAHYATASMHPIQARFDAAGLDAQVLVPVHDSILAEVDEDQIDEAVAIMTGVMTGWNNGAVPLVADTKVGINWANMETYKPGSYGV